MHTSVRHNLPLTCKRRGWIEQVASLLCYSICSKEADPQVVSGQVLHIEGQSERGAAGDAARNNAAMEHQSTAIDSSNRLRQMFGKYEKINSSGHGCP
jgi:hypothetical protein